MVRILLEQTIEFLSKTSNVFFSIHLLKIKKNKFIASMKKIVEKILDQNDDEYKKFPYPYITRKEKWNHFDNEKIRNLTDHFIIFMDTVFYPLSLVLYYFP